MFLGWGKGGCGAGRGLEQEKRAGQQEAGLGALWLSRENIWLPSAPLPKPGTTIFANWSSKSFYGF